MHTINHDLAKLRHEDLLRAAAADRFAARACRAERQRISVSGIRSMARRRIGQVALDPMLDLARVPLFHGFSSAELRALHKHADRFVAARGAVLARESHPEPQFVVIAHGVAEATRDGQRLAIFESGDHFGELTLLEGEPQVPTVVAMTDLTGYAFGRRGFWDALNRVPNLAIRLALRLAEDLARSQLAVARSDQYRAGNSSAPGTGDEGELCDSVLSSSSPSPFLA